MTPAVKKIFADATSGNAWTNRIPRQVIRTGVNRTTPGNIGNDCGISEASYPALIGIIGATDPPCGLNKSQEIGDTRQSTSPDLRNFNKLDTSIYQQFTNNIIAPPIFTEVIGDKISGSSIWYLYTRCWTKLASDPVNIPESQFVDLELSTINALGKGSSPWTPATIVGRPMYIAHRSVPDHIFEKNKSIRDNTSVKSDYNSKK